MSFLSNDDWPDPGDSDIVVKQQAIWEYEKNIAYLKAESTTCKAYLRQLESLTLEIVNRVTKGDDLFYGDYLVEHIRAFLKNRGHNV